MAAWGLGWFKPRTPELSLGGSSVRLVHLVLLRDDIRGEIKTRIQQRDTYSVQLVLALGAIFAAAFVQPGLDKVLIAAPLASIYFTMLILYSYRIHDVLARYLRTEIEPRLAQLVLDAEPGQVGGALDWDLGIEWENWYVSRAQLRPGLRRTFFYWTSIGTTVGSLSYLWIRYSGSAGFRVALAVSTGGYAVATVALTLAFRHDLSSGPRSSRDR